jgi:hypothetical protein
MTAIRLAVRIIATALITAFVGVAVPAVAADYSPVGKSTSVTVTVGATKATVQVSFDVDCAKIVGTFRGQTLPAGSGKSGEATFDVSGLAAGSYDGVFTCTYDDGTKPSALGSGRLGFSTGVATIAQTVSAPFTIVVKAKDQPAGVLAGTGGAPLAVLVTGLAFVIVGGAVIWARRRIV